MIFVDTNVLMYAVGRAHPLKEPARQFFEQAIAQRTRLCTSAEVLQELLHAYLPASRMDTFDEAITLIERLGMEIWPLTPADVSAAAALRTRFPALGARDLCHLACCRQRQVTAVQSYDRGLASAFA